MASPAMAAEALENSSRPGRKLADSMVGSQTPAAVPGWCLPNPRSGVPEAPDQPRRTLRMPVEGREQLISSHAGLQLLRLEVGGDQREGVMVPVARRRAGAGVVRDVLGALAAHVLRRGLADLAFGETRHRCGYAVGDPVHHAQAGAALRVVHDQRIAART